jgi:small subunit ribosomal protein S21
LHPCLIKQGITIINKKASDNKMIIVPVKEGESIDRALKKLKRKFEKTGVVKELRERQKFTKPSVKRREAINKAIYIQQLQQSEEGL